MNIIRVFLPKNQVLRKDLFNFTAHFGTEADCRNHFKSERDQAKSILVSKAFGNMNAKNTAAERLCELEQ
jgi:hypothetical protein